MDPVSALSLASNILSVIDISSKVLKSAYKLYQSDNDTTEEAAHSGFIIEDLQKAAQSIELHHRGLTPHEQALDHLTKRTTDLSNDIIDTLSSSKIQGKRSMWRAFQTSLKLSVKSSKLDTLMERARAFRSEIILRLNLMLVNENSEVKQSIERLYNQSRELQSKSRFEFDRTNEKLQKVLKVVQASDNRDQATRSEYLSSVREIQKLLESLKAATTSITHQNMILRLLYFPSIHWREDTITDPASQTFEWLTSAIAGRATFHVNSRQDTGEQKATQIMERGTYEEESAVEALKSEGQSVEGILAHTNQRMKYEEEIAAEAVKREEVSRSFEKFLTGDDGIFFIAGKPGCGKSTLMKHISPSKNKYVRGALDHWAKARQRPLVLMPIYFWISGDKLQRSVEGFYRTLMFHFLRQQPEAMLNLFPDSGARYADEVLRDQPIRLSEILTAVSRMVTTNIFDNYALCIFVDGLDEYVGDKVEHLELARLLRDWAKHENVKVLCSARPYEEFMETFRDVATVVRLEELTRADIALYAFDRLRNEQQLQTGDTRNWSSEHDSLVTQIVQRSEGVFIWSRTVVRFLSTKVGHSSTKDLSALLDNTPTTMNELYMQMLSRRKPMARNKGNMLLFVVCSLPDLNNALSLSWLDDFKDPNFPMNQTPSFYPPAEVDRRLRVLSSEFSDGTAGLLELRKYFTRREFRPFFDCRAVLVHRTARDFLNLEWLPSVLPTISLPASIEDISRRMSLAEATFSVHSCYKKAHPEDTGYYSPRTTARYPRLTERYYAATCSSGYNRKSQNIGYSDFEKCSELPLMENQSFERLYSAYETLSDVEGRTRRPATRALEMCFEVGEGVYHLCEMDYGPASFVHLALFRGQIEYVRERIAAEPSLVTSNNYNVSLLLTSLIRGYGEFAREIIRAGASFDDVLLLEVQPPWQESSTPETRSYTLWSIMLVVILAAIYLCTHQRRDGTEPEDFSSRISTIFREMVRHEDGDWNIGVVVNSAKWESHHYVELVEFLELAPATFIHPSDLGILRERVSHRNLPSHGNRALWKMPQGTYPKFLSNWVGIIPSTDSGGVGSSKQTYQNTYPHAHLDGLCLRDLYVHGVFTNTEKVLGEGFRVRLY
ncbi:hypothetical protein GGR57DRAFT_114669 [Xylariaceae sp. FL1272]|nr:hypothetical protein GGR57DRAFT_114669 [Xylariaceae sp. FL1272]